MEYHGVIEIDDQDEDQLEGEDDEQQLEIEDDETEDEDDAYEHVELIPSVVTSPRVSNLGSRAGILQEAAVFSGDSVDDMKSCKEKLRGQENVGDGEEEFNEFEIDGLNCPICIEAWTSGGEHQICCLPCGHIYGLSCIKKWLRQRRSSGKCPQCKRTCTLKDVRVLYAARLCVVDAELQKQVRSLEAKCVSLEQKNADYCKKEVEAQEREADLHLKVEKLTKKAKYLESLLKDRQREPLGSSTGNLGYQRNILNDNGFGSEVSSGVFTLQREFQVDGGRYFDMDASGQLMIVARRPKGMAGTSLLTKISLIAPNQREDIQLSDNLKVVRALCVQPCSRLVLLASLGKKLSIVSTESNNTVLTYDLPVPAWSCSWDIESPHHVYAGLQNGTVLGFDMRQTRKPLEDMKGLSCNPVHSMTSIPCNSSGQRTLLTASQIGMCEWNIGTSQDQRPYLIPESMNKGVCISLAHAGGDDIVASFRPKIETSSDLAVSQSLPTTPMPCGVEGSHIFYKRTGTQSYHQTGSLMAQLPNLRLPKSSIINNQKRSPVFVSANEVTSELLLLDIPKLAVVQRLKTPYPEIRDVRCTHIWDSCVLGCLSGDVMQLFTSR